MAKNKGSSEVEYLRGKVRELTKINRQLQKQVGRKEKRPEEVTEVDEFEDFVMEDPSKCKKCNKGSLTSASLGIRVIITCNSCDFREIKRN